jgi:glucose-6-phosphate 1-dehydrogenase
MTGKHMSEKKAEVLITFKKDTSKDFFFNNDNVENNLLAFKIQPTEGVYLRINSKVPGNNDVSTVSLDYCQTCNTNYSSPEAYEKLLFDCLNRDKTLFASWEEIKYSWTFIDSITKSCESRRKALLKYPRGVEDIKESTKLIGGGKWFLD